MRPPSVILTLPVIAACGCASGRGAGGGPASTPPGAEQTQHARHGDAGGEAAHGGPAHGGPAHEGGRHGNPGDLAAYVARMTDPERAQWQKPDEVISALALEPGQVVCDIGAGPGYFALRAAGAVGTAGTVYAVDVEPEILAALRARIAESGLGNVVPVLALPGDPLLPAASCDLILVVDTYHHFPDGPAYLRRLIRSLKPGGRLVNIDFHGWETPVGPPVDRRISEEAFRRDADAAGLEVIAALDLLPYQYFLVTRPRPTP
ncbi:methyltransferase domain-containing protein [Myxococcota bacterium]|nr:methyltransferase domain-containing protein [Myxococcota bacterium]